MAPTPQQTMEQLEKFSVDDKITDSGVRVV